MTMSHNKMTKFKKDNSVTALSDMYFTCDHTISIDLAYSIYDAP